MDDRAITIHNVSKVFRLPHEKQNSIKGMLISLLQGGKGSYEEQRVLKDITFEIQEGEFFGIVGRNGSGKSTLLKMLAGIYAPTKGSVKVNGKLTPFIELGVGFNPELTGRENVYLNGALLGFNRKEMNVMYDDIVAFAEIQKFMDQKLKNYSSGMQVRLAFSIAIRAQTDILLIDEVLAVGDTAFQRKCFEHFMKLKKERRTVVLVTHDMGAVERFCDRAAVIDKSELKGVFTPREAAVLYEELNQEAPVDETSKKAIEEKAAARWGTQKGKIAKTNLLVNGQPIKKGGGIPQGSDVTLTVDLKTGPNSPEAVVVGMAFYDEFGVNMAGPNSQDARLTDTGTISYEFKNFAFNPGKYTVTIALFDKDVIEEYDHIEKAIVFVVTADSHQLHGKVNLFGTWRQDEA